MRKMGKRLKMISGLAIIGILVPSFVMAGNVKKVFVNVAKEGQKAQVNDIPANYGNIETELKKLAYSYSSNGMVFGYLRNVTKGTDGGAKFAGNNNSFVEINDTPEIKVKNAYTVEAWVKPNTYGNAKQKTTMNDGNSSNILSKMLNSSSYTGPFWWEYRNNGVLNGYHLGSNNNYAIPSIGLLPVDKWSHIATSYDASTGTAKIYMNGVLMQTSTLAGAGPLRDSIGLYIGTGKSTTYGNGFDGEVRDVRLWNVVRSDQEIKNYMTVGIKGNEKGLVGFWPLNIN